MKKEMKRRLSKTAIKKVMSDENIEMLEIEKPKSKYDVEIKPKISLEE